MPLVVEEVVVLIVPNKSYFKRVANLALLFTLVSCGAQDSTSNDEELEDGISDEEHRIFVTSTQTTGNIGGLSAADDYCQTLATAAGLTRTYKAILSTTAESADSLLDVTGAIVKISGGEKVTILAEGEVSLWDDSDLTLSSFIDVDENGDTISDDLDEVWTGTTASGGSDFDNCSDWTSESDSVNGSFGDVNSQSFEWVNSSFSSCDQSKSLYCLSQ